MAPHLQLAVAEVVAITEVAREVEEIITVEAEGVEITIAVAAEEDVVVVTIAAVVVGDGTTMATVGVDLVITEVEGTMAAAMGVREERTAVTPRSLHLPTVLCLAGITPRHLTLTVAAMVTASRFSLSLVTVDPALSLRPMVRRLLTLMPMLLLVVVAHLVVMMVGMVAVGVVCLPLITEVVSAMEPLQSMLP